MDVTGKEEADRGRAWVAFSTNLVVLPGLGSLLMGRPAGWVQAPLALIGLTLSVRWLLLVLLEWRRDGALPAAVPHGGLLLAGVATFVVAWLWALATGLAALRRARAAAPGK
jgi:hypothetical protein